MDLDKKYDYKISIVMAVYNVEEYVEESIKSIVEQDIGFKDNIQLILINDGSLDESGCICKKYAEQYKNILYLEKENGGVSSARNLGLEHIKGKYVNFLDSDDLLSKETCRLVYDFFEQNNQCIDVVGIPVVLFEGRTGNHILNYKFVTTRVVDVKKSYNNIQLGTTSSFIKASALENRRFDVNLRYAEDAKLLTEIILDKFAYGVVIEAKHFYRIRKKSQSAIQTSKQRFEWYIPTLENFHLKVIEYCKDKYGYIPKYVQFILMYDIQWRLNFNGVILSEEDMNKYVSLLSYILTNVDDTIIFSQKNINMEYKRFALYLKMQGNGNDIHDNIHKISTADNMRIYYKDILLEQLKDKSIQIDILKLKNGKLNIEANIQTMIDIKNIEISMIINGVTYKADYILRDTNKYIDMSLSNSKIECLWKIDLPDVDTSEIKFYIKYKGNENIMLSPCFSKTGRLVTKFKTSYYSQENHIFIKTGKTIIVFKSNLKRLAGREYRYLLELLKNKEYKPVISRVLYFLSKPFFKNKKIWLFADRPDKAGDNAESFVKYVKKADKNIDTYFIIDKTSSDYQRIKSITKVLDYESYKTKLYYLHADKVISSQIDEVVINPFGGQEQFYRGLMNYDKVFLQHGIIQSDFTTWLNKYNKDINLFVTSAENEYKSILEKDYYYDKDVVKLTGLPRYDYLKDKKKNQLIIMPTWRQDIVERTNMHTGKREYNTRFKDSDYFEKWNNLINSSKLISIAKKLNYEILFVPHPNIMQQVSDFTENEYVKIIKEDVNYNTLFCESSLLVTDYSSVAFDFAYMSKPVIYYQFDIDEFFENHTSSKGYFEYETMGFGPVFKEEEELVDKIINYVQNKCIMDEVYKERVKSFYKYTDSNNCERVYNEIKQL